MGPVRITPLKTSTVKPKTIIEDEKDIDDIHEDDYEENHEDEREDNDHHELDDEEEGEER